MKNSEWNPTMLNTRQVAMEDVRGAARIERQIQAHDTVVTVVGKTGVVAVFGYDENISYPKDKSSDSLVDTPARSSEFDVYSDTWLR